MKILFRLVLLFLLTACVSNQEEMVESDTLFSLVSPDYSGVEFKNEITETRSSNHLVNDMLISGGGVGVGDINNDGLPDLYFTGNQVRDELYLNKGNFKFERITDEAGIVEDHVWSSGVTFVDINKDGWQDIYVCKYTYGNENLGANLLYINNKDNTFSEKAIDYGLSDRGFSVQANFFDFDLDGYLDMYLVNQPPSTGNRRGNKITLTRLKSLKYSDKIFKNMGNGKFYDVSEYCGVRNLSFGLSATVTDYNNDGWPDIYVANDYEKPDQLFINQRNGQFVNTINSAMGHISNFSMGVDAADYDNDGSMDLMVVDMVPEDHKRLKTNMGGMNPSQFWDIVNKGWHHQYMFNTLQRNNGDATFGELGQLAGVSSTDWSWTPLFGDYDLDGYKDLFISNGSRRAMRNSDLDDKYDLLLDSLDRLSAQTGKKVDELIDLMEFVELSPVEKMPNYIFKNNGDLTFSKKVEEWGFEDADLAYGAAYADLDNDGDLDLILNNTDEISRIYRNHAVEKGLGNYLNFVILGKDGSPAYGSRVNLYKDGKFWQMGEMTNVRGYKSKSQDLLHFGVGDLSTIEKVEIIWPNGYRKFYTDLDVNQLLEVEESESARIPYELDSVNLVFKPIRKDIGLIHRHKENSFDDYENEVLLPYKQSTQGPSLAVGDIDKNGLDDFFIGSSADNESTIYEQNEDGTFTKKEIAALKGDAKYEDVGAHFFDCDNDGDLDLYVVSGGNEFPDGSSLYQDRLYINRNGVLVKDNSRLPKISFSGKEISSFDYDSDGDLDLFVGARLKAQAYPRPTSSILLENNGAGKFTDVTSQLAPDLKDAGLVTDAVWTDLESDNEPELVVVGEWMAPLVLSFDGRSFVNRSEELGIRNMNGWYYSIAADDLDGDGDVDLVLGNLGLNSKYKASVEAPFEVFSGDLDSNGSMDIVLSYYAEGEYYPVRGRSCSSQQIPQLAEKFPTFDEFGDASTFEVYGEALEKALNYKAHTFASMILENTGDRFITQELHMEAQISSINSILIDDFDGDDKKDILIAGNMYDFEIETPRNDASIGLMLKGDGTLNYEPKRFKETGFFADGDCREMAIVNSKDAKRVLVANNNGLLQVFEYGE